MAATTGGAGTPDVADRLHTAAIHLLRRLRREDEAAGLSAPELSALSVLVFGGSRSVGELAEAEQVRAPTMSRLLGQLEGKGLVERTRDDADRRVIRVRATDAGVERLREGRQQRVAALAGRLERLDAREMEELESAVGLLERLLRERW